jgi:hypothetical protein
MKGMKGSRKSGRALRMETLERRELMAGDVAVNLAGGTLNIVGSAERDTVHISESGGVTRILANGRTATVPNNYNSINIDLGGGKDALNLYLPRMRNLQNVNVNMGSGIAEDADINIGQVRSLSVNSVAAQGVDIKLIGKVVDQAILDFGSDNITDKLFLDYADINRAVVRMGGGNDSFSMKYSTIRNADIQLGSGNDVAVIYSTSEILGGVLDGGTGSEDAYRRSGARMSRVLIRGFERS